MVGLDPGRQVGVEPAAADARAVPIDPPPARGRDPREHLGIARDHPGEVHDLGDAMGAVAVDQLGDVARAQLGAGALQRRSRHAARRVHAERERHRLGRLDQRQDPRDAEHVRELVRIDGDRGRAVRQHRRDELIDPQLRRLHVHVRVDEPRRQRGPADIDRFVRASRSPHPAITPSAIASDVSIHSRVAALNTRPPLISRSAGSSPLATAIARGVAGGRATTQRCHTDTFGYAGFTLIAGRAAAKVRQ